MDYEKKYKNALTIARSRFKIEKDESVLTCLGMMFPELRESEDEKIRTLLVALVQWAKTFKQSGLDSNTANKMLSYLEKQKEQKPEEKQDYSGLNDLERAIHRGFLCAGVENVPVTIIKDTAAECMGFLALIEPKPAEWSEEDKKMRNLAIEWAETKSGQCNFVGMDSTDFRKIATWLKSLRPSWKPSEEQIYSLGTVVKGAGYVSVGSVGYNLKSLYEQLKKL